MTSELSKPIFKAALRWPPSLSSSPLFLSPSPPLPSFSLLFSCIRPLNLLFERFRNTDFFFFFNIEKNQASPSPPNTLGRSHIGNLFLYLLVLQKKASSSYTVFVIKKQIICLKRQIAKKNVFGHL